MRVLAVLCAALVLTGCATLEREANRVAETLENHPIATAVAVGIVGGSIAASQGGRAPVRGGDEPPICRTNPQACQ